MNRLGMVGTRGRRAVVGLLLVATTLSVAALTAGAAPAPTTTVTVVCYRGVDVNPGEGPGVGIDLYSASDQWLGGRFFECPAGGGGKKFTARITTSVLPKTARYSCWNGFIQTGSGTALNGECSDTVPDPDVAFASFAVRLPSVSLATVRTACRDIGGAFAAPGTDVTGDPFPGATLVWTCNDWPFGLTPAPVPSTWGEYCQGTGGDSWAITSNQPPAGQRTGISCFDRP